MNKYFFVTNWMFYMQKVSFFFTDTLMVKQLHSAVKLWRSREFSKTSPEKLRNVWSVICLSVKSCFLKCGTDQGSSLWYLKSTNINLKTWRVYSNGYRLYFAPRSTKLHELPSILYLVENRDNGSPACHQCLNRKHLEIKWPGNAKRSNYRLWKRFSSV